MHRALAPLAQPNHVPPTALCIPARPHAHSQVLLRRFLPESVYANNKTAWKRIMAAYNLSMSAYSLLSFVGTLSVVLRMTTRSPQCSHLYQSALFDTLAYLFYLR